MTPSDREIRAALEHPWSDITDQERVHEIDHDDVVVEFPQGNGRIVGLATRGRCARPTRQWGRLRQAPHPRRRRLPSRRGPLTYDGGQPTHATNVLESRDGKAIHETISCGEPWEPPAWRAGWVETME